MQEPLGPLVPKAYAQLPPPCEAIFRHGRPRRDRARPAICSVSGRFSHGKIWRESCGASGQERSLAAPGAPQRRARSCLPREVPCAWPAALAPPPLLGYGRAEWISRSRVAFRRSASRRPWCSLWCSPMSGRGRVGSARLWRATENCAAGAMHRFPARQRPARETFDDAVRTRLWCAFRGVALATA